MSRCKNRKRQAFRKAVSKDKEDRNARNRARRDRKEKRNMSLDIPFFIIKGEG